MLLHLIHTIQVGSEQILKNGIHDIYLSIDLTHNRFQSHISNHRIKIHHIGIIYMTIVMLGNSYGTRSMKNKREIDQSTTTNP
jgi:hypothetical protein